ncbi:MAG: hypothetical protein ACREOE_20300 [Gemmatimonadales bacterium]
MPDNGGGSGAIVGGRQLGRCGYQSSSIIQPMNQGQPNYQPVNYQTQQNAAASGGGYGQSGVISGGARRLAVSSPETSRGAITLPMPGNPNEPQAQPNVTVIPPQPPPQQDQIPMLPGM